MKDRTTTRLPSSVSPSFGFTRTRNRGYHIHVHAVGDEEFIDGCGAFFRQGLVVVLRAVDRCKTGVGKPNRAGVHDDVEVIQEHLLALFGQIRTSDLEVNHDVADGGLVVHVTATGGPYPRSGERSGDEVVTVAFTLCRRNADSRKGKDQS